MPTYEYRCPDCGHKFEKFQSIMAAPLKECPGCHKKRVRRLIGSGAGVLFKGSGFYTTDYRSEAYKESAKAESASSEAKPADVASKDAKPADAASKDVKPAIKAETAAPAKTEPQSPPKAASRSAAKKSSRTSPAK